MSSTAGPIRQPPWCNLCGNFHDSTGCRPVKAPALVTAPTWPEVVVEVEHDADCPHTVDCGLPCECSDDRDARIGEGIAAVRESDNRCNALDLRPPVLSKEWRAQIAAKDAAAIAAFREASKPKEEG